MSATRSTEAHSVNRPVKHLYIHIPFCARRCAYCDFNTYANLEHRITAYVAALCTEIELLAVDPDAQSTHDTSLPPTIFFGGGTPSMLTLAQLEQVLRAAGRIIPLEAAEITLEANPGSVLGNGTTAPAYLRGLRDLGVNRLSLGVQSLHDPTLRILGRTHTAEEAQRCFAAARHAGFDNINLDFIFGLPGQTLAQWEATLDEVTTWGVDHFSLYSLILEEQTPLYAQVLRGQISLPDDDATAAMYEAAMQRFAAAGYAQYEVSNWARVKNREPRTENQGIGDGEDIGLPALACRHNLAYWLNSDYLAAGAGAHGHVYPRRYANLCGVDSYIEAVQAGRRPLDDLIDLTPQDLYAETMFMGLRLNVGVSRDHFRQRCGVAMEEIFGPTLAELTELGLLEQNASGVRLTPRGRMLGNQVFARFV
jgi:oxygen-independent coproporphyrinogen-3 oxidase